MKPIQTLGAIVIVSVLIVGSNVYARKPGTLSGPTITSASGSVSSSGSSSGDLLIKWTESGLTPGAYPNPIQYEVNGSTNSVYVCVDSTGKALPVSATDCASTTTSGGNDACEVTQTVAYQFPLNGLSGTKSSVSNTVAVDEAFSGNANIACTNLGGTLLLYSVDYSGITISDISTPGGPYTATVTGGGPDFTATMCLDSRLANCPPVS